MRIDSQILQNIAFFFRNADDAQSGNNAAGTGFVDWVETRETGITSRAPRSAPVCPPDTMCGMEVGIPNAGSTPRSASP